MKELYLKKEYVFVLDNKKKELVIEKKSLVQNYFRNKKCIIENEIIKGLFCFYIMKNKEKIRGYISVDDIEEYFEKIPPVVRAIIKEIKKENNRLDFLMKVIIIK